MKLSLSGSTLISALLHAGAAAFLFWMVRLHAAPPTRPKDPLAVELVGMIADRQTAQRTATRAAPEPVSEAAPQPAPAEKTPDTPPPPPPPKPAPQKPQPKPKQIAKPAVKPTPAQTQIAQSPVKIPENPPDPAPQTAPPAPEQPVAPASPAAPDTRSAQEQQRLDKQAEEAAFKQYLSRLSKKIQAHLVYPDAVKKSGHEGIATVRFVLTESGHIQPGTLSIARTSDSTVLDASALQAVRDAAPFERPPRQITLSIGIHFSQAALVR